MVRPSRIIASIPLLLWMAFVVYLSLLPAKKLPRKLLRLDDFFLHAVIHAVFVFLAVAAWQRYDVRSPAPRWLLLGTLCISFSFGSLMEFLQSQLTTYRSASLQDVMANTIGAVLMVLLLVVFDERRSKMPMVNKPK